MALTYFNSIKVQLELKFINKSPLVEKFQFHKGTIRTILMHMALKTLIPLFQFHKGTIRTVLQVLPICPKLNFNSIKVQLEQQNTLTIAPYFQFQFHKGTIRTGGTMGIEVSYDKFQFHKGTIRTG